MGGRDSMMTFIFCIALLLIAISIITIAVSTIEYFINKHITKAIIIEYRQTLKITTIIFIIGIALLKAYIHTEGIPQLIGW